MRRLGLQKIYQDLQLGIRGLDLIFSAIFTLILVFGHVLSHNPAADVTVGKSDLVGYLLISVVVWFVVLFILIGVRKYAEKKSFSISSRNQLFLGISDGILWAITSFIIFLFYTPAIILSQSELTYDSWNIISQSTGNLPLTNAHPLIFTLLVSVFMKIGSLFGGVNVGVLLYSIFQSAILAVIFARIIVWQRQVGVGIYGILATFLFYAILPVNAFAGTILWKDVLFAGVGLMLLLKLWVLCVQGNDFFTKKNILWFITLAFAFCILRNNALYAYTLFAILFVFINKKVLFNIRGVALIFSPIILSIVYLFSTSLFVGSASSVESMSVPLQQIARTVKYHSDSITSNDKETINEILPYNKLAQVYNPGLSDPVKWVFDNKKFSENKSKYLSLWLELSKKYPKTFSAAFLYNTYGYIYPLIESHTTTDIILNNNDQINALGNYSDSAYKSGSKKALAVYRDVISSALALTRNVGLYTCILLIAIYLSIIKRNGSLTGVFVLLACLYISVIFGPVNGEFRYLYLFVIAAPILLTAPLIKLKKWLAS